MITEIAVLHIREGEEASFEKAFEAAGQYISSIEGYLGHSLKKCLETAHKYVLIANWRKLEDHEIGFRNSEQYLEWKKLLHHYYDPFPIVEHHEDII